MSIDVDVLSRAMTNAVLSNDPNARNHGDKIEFYPWWREQSSPSRSCALFIARAKWCDSAGGVSGGMTEMAEVMGMTRRAFLDRYGSMPAPVIPTPRDPPSAWQPGEAAATWERHADAHSYDVVRWLRQRRGLPCAPPSGARACRVGAFPAHAQEWVEKFTSWAGACALIPMRSPVSRRIESLVLRPLIPRKGRDGDVIKSMTVKGLSWRGEGALAFGATPLRGDPPTIAVICEGAPDTWTAECLISTLHGLPMIVYGANGVGQIPKIARMLFDARARVVVIPQADHINPRTSRAAVATLTAAGVHAVMLRWPLCRRFKDINEMAQAWRGSWVELAECFKGALQNSLDA